MSKDEEHNFKAGAKFSNVISLYYLDADLKNLLSRYLNRIEINFRTKLVYYVSNKYKDSPTWFVDSAAMSSNYISDFDKYYNAEFIRDNKPIKKHHQKYINDRYAPAWKTIEFFTFGGILKIFTSLKAKVLPESKYAEESVIRSTQESENKNTRFRFQKYRFFLS